MAQRRPLVVVSGVVRELPSGDTLPPAALVYQRRVQTVGTATGAVTCNWGLYDEIRLTLTGSVTLTFSGANDGQGCTLKLVQGGAGSHTVALDGAVRYSADITGYTPTATAGKGDRLGFIRDVGDGKYDFVSVIKGF